MSKQDDNSDNTSNLLVFDKLAVNLDSQSERIASLIESFRTLNNMLTSNCNNDKVTIKKIDGPYRPTEITILCDEDSKEE